MTDKQFYWDDEGAITHSILEHVGHTFDTDVARRMCNEYTERLAAVP